MEFILFYGFFKFAGINCLYSSYALYYKITLILSPPPLPNTHSEKLPVWSLYNVQAATN